MKFPAILQLLTILFTQHKPVYMLILSPSEICHEMHLWLKHWISMHGQCCHEKYLVHNMYMYGGVLSTSNCAALMREEL